MTRMLGSRHRRQLTFDERPQWARVVSSKGVATCNDGHESQPCSPRDGQLAASLIGGHAVLQRAAQRSVS